MQTKTKTEEIYIMSKELNSQFKANSFCCTLNNIDKLFDVNDTSFNDEKYSDETRNK